MKTYIILISFFIGIISSNAQTTAIPDPNFEQALIDLGIDSDGSINGQVLTADISSITNLAIPHFYNISNLTGIEDFAALGELDISGSSLNHIDLTNNSNLKKLRCNDVYSLQSIDLFGNPLLEELYCSNTQNDVPIITDLTEIDLSNNQNIQLIIAKNLTNLQTVNLKSGNNNATTPLFLDISFDAGPRPNPGGTNGGVCIQVDSKTLAEQNYYPYYTWTIIANMGYYFSENCALYIEEYTKYNIQLYPNPATELFRVNSQQKIETIHIYDLQGKLVKSFSETQENYTVADLTEGMYFVQIQSVENQKQLLKFVKE